MDKYTMEFKAYLRLISLNEINKYKNFISYETSFLNTDGMIKYVIDDSNNVHYDDDDDDSYWYEEDDEAYCAIVGYSSADEVHYASAGDELAINDVNIIVMDPKTGFILLNDGIESVFVYDDTEEYIFSEIYFTCEHLSNAYKSKLKLVETDLPVPNMDKSKYLLSKADYNNGNAENIIITGETGCGKTYKAVNDEIKNGRRFAYIAPCRQLVYETYRYYADKNVDILSTGEIKINSGSDGNFFGVYESMHPEMVVKFDTLIIDEAHFVKDHDRGGLLLTLIKRCRENDINIVLLTATQNFILNDFKNIILPAQYNPPKKIEVDYKTAYRNIMKGMQTIWFCGSIDDTIARSEELKRKGINAIAVNSAMMPSERLKAQIAFEKKDVQVVCATNVLAQGVNFECENLIIDDDSFETPAQQVQKLGRLGRPGTLISKNKVYYTISYKLDKPSLPKIKTRIVETDRSNDYIYDQLNAVQYKVKYGYKIYYNDIKYCIPEFKEYAKNFIDTHLNEEDRFSTEISILNDAMEMISNEEKCLTDTILNNMRKTPSLK